MKNKILFISAILSNLLFYGCSYQYYRYQAPPIKVQDNQYKLLDIEAELIDNTKEKSPVNVISIHYWNYYKQYPEILSTYIKIKEKSGKIWTLVVDFQYKNIIKVHEQGCIITEGFWLEVGEIKLSNGKIVTLSPIFLNQYVEMDRVNKILDTMNIDTKEEVFSGTVEEYKKANWRDKEK